MKYGLTLDRTGPKLVNNQKKSLVGKTDKFTTAV
jgi:hypothetical protein